MKFRLGDRVRYIGSGDKYDKRGTVVYCDKPHKMYIVNLDECISGINDWYNCEKGHGLCCDEEYLELEESKKAKFKVGDRVKIIDSSLIYTTYAECFKNKNNAEDYDIYNIALYWKHGRDYESKIKEFNNKEFEVVFIGNFSHYFNVCAVKSKDKDGCNRTLLIKEEGLKLVKRKMTIGDIENELGYKVEVVSEV